jgi:hypothetical protein
MSTESLDLTPSVVLARAADIIERQGLARGNYFTASGARPARDCPVCTYGAVAVAVGCEPDAWESETYGAVVQRARAALLRLADHLGVTPWGEFDDEDEDEVPTLDGWSDSTDPAVVVAELRAAAKAGA